MFLWWDSDKEHTYLDVDFEKQEHIDCIQKLCERNTFYANEVCWFMHQSIHLEEIFDMAGMHLFDQRAIDSVNRNQHARENWIARGLLALNGNEVVGFLLYSIHRETKQELAFNFLLIDKKHRKKNHGCELLSICEERHCFNIEYEELGIVYFNELFNIKKGEIQKSKEWKQKVERLQSQNKYQMKWNATSEYELAEYMTTKIKRDENFDGVVGFYKKNGFIDLNDKPSWCEILSHEVDPNFLILVRVGPKTCAEVCEQDGHVIL
jgi:hypothetical protein